MTIDLPQLVLLGIVCAATHWLVARSEIARPLWSRAPGVLGRLLACAGCSGFWLGGVAWTLGIRVTPLDARYGGLALAMVLGTFVTPIFEGMLMWGLYASAVQDDAPEPPPPPPVPQESYITPVDNPSRRVPK